jgi:gliding motility-associated-like protein
VTTDLSVVILDLKLSRDTLINLGDSVKISASISQPLDVSWKWQPNTSIKCDTCAITWVKPNTNTIYQVEATDKSDKCHKTGTVSIKTKSECTLYIPTAFSPNGDNINDKWTIYPSNCVKTIKRLLVFNRWGNLILSKNDIAVSSNQGIDIWDGQIEGKEIEIDTFVYVLEAEYTNGEKEIIGGDFSIMR